ncbi:FAD-binding and (Fe-S)-binding domain-containing protein [Myroides sp. DW712]|uniref:FAD-binding and (Fe-S)-binding domain-containing protein n=1 Tax=Myroides sp. DW712 TaxID=3389800 RepID=UPI00397C6BFD
MLSENYAAFVRELENTIPAQQIMTHPIQTLAYGTDASFYRLVPQVVVEVKNEAEAVSAIALAYHMQLPITYRAGGTSLSGQAITDSILLVATHHWKNYSIEEDGLRATFQPGIIGGRANILLAPYGRKIGPDPGSIHAAMIGGIAANNASGMCCGTAQNSYNTIADIRLVFYDGTILDTADSKSKQQFEIKHPEILAELQAIHNEIQQDSTLYERIQRKYKIKNTTGYSLNAFIDYQDPFDILKHLIIGSEGTLAFISTITYNTVINYQKKACTLLVFDSIATACQAVPFLKKSPVAAVELLDRNSIRSIENEPQAPAYFKTLPASACLLLVEVQANSQEEIARKQEEVQQALASFSTLAPFVFTSDPKEYAFNWKARNGLLPTTGALRATGTTCIIEDVAFPLDQLATASIALQQLFTRYQYNDAVLFGHALEGNLHLVFSQDFSTPASVQRYADLMDELVHLVVHQFDGSLKAEHGTGRNMAPFVEKEWGAQAYALMLRIKQVFDPHQVINPGVMINTNPHIHLENLKATPATHPIVDKCIECGFCESHCVSEGLTLSPRQRIVVGREIARLEQTHENPLLLQQLRQKAQYYLDDTCATDGLCAIACPVKIDTGKYVKSWRSDHLTAKNHQDALYFVEHLDRVTQLGRYSLKFVRFFQNTLGNRTMLRLATQMRTWSKDRIPQWNHAMPTGTKTRVHPVISNTLSPRKVVYFPSCINRTMGTSKDYNSSDLDVKDLTVLLLHRAGYEVIIPENIENLCCGMPFSSKGYQEEGLQKSTTLETALETASVQGKYPILFDMSPCYYTFHDQHAKSNFSFYDPIEFILDVVLPELSIKHPREEVTIFPVCSVKKLGLEEKLIRIAKQCAKKVNYIDSNCCGFAGDRGFTFPELNQHGTKDIEKQLPVTCSDGFSTSRTCEIGLTANSHCSFKSIFYLIEEVTR